MQMKLELVPVPVTDVDRAKAFYVDQVGFNADHDQRVSDDLRFVQLTPPGSACWSASAVRTASMSVSPVMANRHGTTRSLRNCGQEVTAMLASVRSCR